MVVFLVTGRNLNIHDITGRYVLNAKGGPDNEFIYTKGSNIVISNINAFNCANEEGVIVLSRVFIQMTHPNYKRVAIQSLSNVIAEWSSNEYVNEFDSQTIQSRLDFLTPIDIQVPYRCKLYQIVPFIGGGAIIHSMYSISQ